MVTDKIKNSQDNPEILEQSMQQAIDYNQFTKLLSAEIPKQFDVITEDIHKGDKTKIIAQGSILNFKSQLVPLISQEYAERARIWMIKH